jgi:WD40 repeat protein
LVGAALAALTGQGASAGAVALTKGAIKMMVVANVKNACLAAVLIGTLSCGVGWFAQADGKAGQEQKQSAAAKAVAQQETKGTANRVDLHGDPLPEGAAMRLGTVQLRAAGANLALSMDGKTLIGVRGGKLVSFWDATSGKLKGTRGLPDSSRRSSILLRAERLSVLSGDGRLLATEDLEIRDVWTGKRLTKLIPPDLQPFVVYAEMAFSPDSTYLAYVGTDAKNGRAANAKHFIRIWEVRTGKQVFAKDFPYEYSRHPLGFSPDSRQMLVFFGDGLCCWDIADGKERWQSKKVFNVSDRIAFSTNGDTILSSIPPVELATGKQVQVANLPPSPRGFQVKQMLAAPDGRTLLLARNDGAVVWDLQTGTEVRKIADVGDEMVLMPDGKSFITAGSVLQRWDLATGKALYADNFGEGHTQSVVALVFSADGKRLLSGGEDGSVRLWDTTSSQPLRVWRVHAPPERLPRIGYNLGGVNTATMSSDGRWIASCGAGEVKVWDTADGKQGPAIKLPRLGKNESGQSGSQLSFYHGGRKLVGVFGAMAVLPPPRPPGKQAGGGKVVMPTHWMATWDLQSGEMLTKLPVAPTSAAACRLSRDGSWLATAGKVLDVVSGKEEVRFEGTESFESLCAISADETLVAFGGGANRNLENPSVEVVIGERATGNKVAVIKTRSDAGILAFHPGNRVVAIAEPNSIQVWDIATAEQVATLRIPPDVPSDSGRNLCVSCLTFAPDGRRFATGHPDGTILLWDVELPSPEVMRLTAKEVEALWEALQGADAAKAWKAVWRLAEAPENVVPFLRKRLKPLAPAPQEVTRPLLADLDSYSFAKREAAGKRFLEMGVLAESALRARLKDNPSLETQRRVEAILKSIAETPQPLTPDVLRELRAIAVLGRMSTADARGILERLGSGAESARLTVAARAALGW